MTKERPTGKSPSGRRRDIAPSLVRPEELELLKKTVLFTHRDEESPRLAGDVLADQLEEVLNPSFRTHPHLCDYFTGPNGTLDAG